MVSFSDVAIFILATTRTNGRHKQDYATYLESRIVPIRESWGQFFPHLYFVFGTNKFDHDFLTQQCTTQKAGRQLAARDRQIPSENVAHLYSCPIYEVEAHYKTSQDVTVDLAVTKESSTSTPLYEFNALWTGNCTGEYFGYGPTCRCQESMRYFNHDPVLQKKEWFIFMDDDIYYRPYALVSLLSSLSEDKQRAGSNAPIALVASNRYRSFQFSKSGPKNDTAKASHRCKDSPAYEFAIAQPAILNRYAPLCCCVSQNLPCIGVEVTIPTSVVALTLLPAHTTQSTSYLHSFFRATMQRLSNGIDANALTGLQSAWGGTHDALLGLLLWMYRVPTYSLNRYTSKQF
jgi:hypothetical protein